MKIIDIDGNETKYNIEDISEMNFVNTNAFYKMIVYKHDTTNTFLTLNIKSIVFGDSNEIEINLATTHKILSIGDIDSIVFVQEICSDVKIGNQTWTCKNLDVDHYRNGDPIPEVTDPIEWAKLKTGAWCYYNNDSILGAIYGKLYNWYAVNDPRGLAPIGWHIPSADEWYELGVFLKSSPGGKLKSTGTIENGDGLWLEPNEGATNETGFSALPGGFRGINDGFTCYEYCTFFWTSTLMSPSQARYTNLSTNLTAYIDGPLELAYGCSIRCIKD